MHMCHGVHVDVSSLLEPCGSYSLNTCCPTWLKALLLADSSLQPQFLYFRLGEQYYRLFSSISHRNRRIDCVITCYLIFETVKLYI